MPLELTGAGNCNVKSNAYMLTSSARLNKNRGKKRDFETRGAVEPTPGSMIVRLVIMLFCDKPS